MMSFEEFFTYVMEPDRRLTVRAAESRTDTQDDEDVLDFFGDVDTGDNGAAEVEPLGHTKSFAKYLLELQFGSAEKDWELLSGHEPLLPSLSVAGLRAFLPSHVQVWDRHVVGVGPAYVVLVEFGAAVGADALFAKAGLLFQQLGKTGRLEDALDRVAQTILDGVRSRAGSRGATAPIVDPSKVLCVVSICDDRCEDPSMRLVTFATVNASAESLETFQLYEEVRTWERPLALEHLRARFDRSFSKLQLSDWQDAFTTTLEREAAGNLQLACSAPSPTTESIHNSVQALINLIAKSYGHAIAPTLGNPLNLKAFDHDIGADPKHPADVNPFPAVTLRDSNQRLLGYILYALKGKAEADLLRKSLKDNNRFHNVLVVYPATVGADGVAEVNVDLWQGKQPLVGKLRQGHKGAAEIVNLLSRFFVVSRAKVKDPKNLAEELAFRARYLRRVAISQLETEPESGPLKQLFKAFTDKLIAGQTKDQFADAFAQTLTYSLLTARWIAATDKAGVPERFTRQTAKKHLTHGSHFLSEMFNAALASPMAGQQTRLDWLIDDIADLLDRLDIKRVFKDEAEETAPERKKDQIIHFYEPFLKEYDPDIKRQRGVFYTPWQVVSYIVRSVHEVLQTEFGLVDGLADVATWGEMEARIPGLKIPAPLGRTDRFVTILDPATGTGTFLVECVEVIYRTLVAKWAALGHDAAKVRELWNDYVPKHLIPRLHGFELLVAPYAVAHLKLRMKLAETGYRFGGVVPELGIFLTNSLEPGEQRGTLALPGMGDAIADEAGAANQVKRAVRFTVVVGNPPYSKISSNLTPELRATVERYRYLDGVRIKEKGALQFEINLQDDYVKFFRMSELTVERAAVGVLGLITNSGYVTAPTLRGLRDSLLDTFDKIWALDLRGHVATRNDSDEGEDDENVFDIAQGVAIFLGLRRGEQKDAAVLSSELNGARQRKFDYLREAGLGDNFSVISCSKPNYLFARNDVDLKWEWELGVPLEEFFPRNSAGVITARDKLTINQSRNELVQRMRDFASCEAAEDEIYRDYGFSASKRFDLRMAQRTLRSLGSFDDQVRPILHRPFDSRFIFFNQAVVWSLSRPMADQMTKINNLALVATKQVTRPQFEHAFVSRHMIEIKCCSHDRNSQIFPLFVVNRSNLGIEDEVVANISPGALSRLSESLGVDLQKMACQGGSDSQTGPMEVFNYVYAILYANSYRRRYFQFLRSNFPRIPIAKNKSLFAELSVLGGRLAALHLVEEIPELGQSTRANSLPPAAPAPRPAEELDTSMNSGGTVREFTVKSIGHSAKTVWIDFDARRGSGSCGFSDVPESVWNFHIGGYQVCEKWLKDRKGRTLTPDDITHYKKIITAITETIRIMAEIDQVIEAHGGWPDAFVTTPPEANTNILPTPLSPDTSSPNSTGGMKGKVGTSKLGSPTPRN